MPTHALIPNTNPALNTVIPVGPLTPNFVVNPDPSGKATLNDTADSQSGTVSTLRPNDVYSFSLASDGFFDGNGNINLSLHDISQGGDADLYLYRDGNGNGILDSSDTLVTSSTKSGNLGESINVRTSPGNYLAQVSRYAPGSAGDVSYKLDLSAARPNNLLPVDVNVGTLSSGSHPTFHGRISSFDTSDVFAFSQGSNRHTRITLSDLTSDADLRVIRDVNKNHIFDSGDTIVGSSANGSNSPETINVNSKGNYLVQAYQYLGDTNYTLKFATT